MSEEMKPYIAYFKVELMAFCKEDAMEQIDDIKKGLSGEKELKYTIAGELEFDKLKKVKE